MQLQLQLVHQKLIGVLHFSTLGSQHGCLEIVDVERDDGVCMADFPNVSRVLAAFVARPAVARGLVVPAQS